MDADIILSQIFGAWRAIFERNLCVCVDALFSSEEGGLLFNSDLSLNAHDLWAAAEL